MHKVIFITSLMLLSGGAMAGTLWKCINENGLAIYTPDGNPEKCKLLVQDEQPSEKRKGIPPREAKPLRFSSLKYKYSLSLPAGWLQIPNAELTRFMERLPPQAQHLIYDAAFQRGNAGSWFEWPHIFVQVIPSERTKINRLPTEQEFLQAVKGFSGGRNLNKLKEAIDAVKDPGARAAINSTLSSLSSASVQVDTEKRKYWLFIDGNDPVDGQTKAYIAGTFLPDGNVIQINVYTKASQFKQDLAQFLEISRSLSAAISK